MTIDEIFAVCVAALDARPHEKKNRRQGAPRRVATFGEGDEARSLVVEPTGEIVFGGIRLADIQIDDDVEPLGNDARHQDHFRALKKCLLALRNADAKKEIRYISTDGDHRDGESFINTGRTSMDNRGRNAYVIRIR